MDRETVEAVRVPDVTGLPFETAKQTIADAGLNFSLQPDFPGPGAEATATSTFPVAGELAIVASTVLLFWADPAVEVPPPPDPAVPGGLVGARENDAVNTVYQAGYNPAVYKHFDLHVDADTVGSVTPAEGTPLFPGSTVNLYVSLGAGRPRRSHIPDPPQTLPPFE